MRRLHKYLALAPAGRALVLRCLLLLPMAAILLQACGMRRTAVLLARMGRRADADALAPRTIARLVDASASILGANCLQRSLVLRQLLRNRGMPAEIRFGVSRAVNGGLSAHAWVELDGLPLNDGADVFERYAALASPAVGWRVDRS